MKKRIIFFGTPSFSVPFLKAIYEASFLDLIAVISEPDRPAGRGRQLVSTPVKQFATNNNISCFQPEKISKFKSEIKRLLPEIIVVVAYGQIIPQDIIDLPKHGAVNVHPSDLPHYRGATPMQSTLLNGDKNTAISIMLIDAKMDHGPILAKKNITIDENDNYSSLEEKVLSVGPKLLIDTLDAYLKNLISPVSQNHHEATFTKMLDKNDGLIDWDQTISQIHNKIRAYNVWPRAYTFINNKRLLILKSHIASGKLFLDLVQLEGKKAMPWKIFLQGNKNILPKQLTDKIG